jgi:putative Holliday junction resolvase
VKYLGLDIGDRRIGLAFGDSILRMAVPLGIIQRDSLDQDIRSLWDQARQYEIEALVVGLPRNTDGTFGPQAEATRAFAERVAGALNLPLLFWDEHLTTVEATRRHHETGARGKKSRRNLDALAAAVILQDFLDSLGPDDNGLQT